MSSNVLGTEGYAEYAAQMIERWERMPFSDLHGDVAHLLPEVPSLILDVGAGSGRDASALAEMGHSIVAVEPVDALRNFGSTRHRSSRIEWVDDSLPDLNVVRSMNLAFDVAMLTAVWMHIDASERVHAMRHLSSLLLHGGHVLMTIRHGPVPTGRRMFEVTHDETVQLAAVCGLRCVHSDTTGSIQESNRNQGVTWTRLAFRRN
ncbi:bifunctional 2-polyprenyl-6-hydroxyphenol methylase/3-demethylubiquinol 3-O-methyltransferase UbiG [Caballeronia novacaledonica]|uniref:Methyltransferase domain-containing protein n=1 Tax=Caballeronia novacaledonica TaxID=1544861 RepID=A0AA37IGK1_9BURK|nr:class I SAM-dependent methyltransferase [Caballeronia novacaledonica]GJH29282.1 methyltransferase domain-containing protein [Caballeronia novacaledonica]